MQRLMAKVLEETQSRETADLARNTLEIEVDNLTASLFTEANRMVAVERIARATAEAKATSVEQTTGDMAEVLDGLQGSLREKVELLDERDRELITLRQQVDKLNEMSTMTTQASDAVFSDGEIVTRMSNGHPSRAVGVLLDAPRLSTTTLPYQEFLAFIGYLRQLRRTILARPIDPPGLLSSPTRSAHDLSLHAKSTPTQIMTPYLPLSSHLSQPFVKRCIEEDSDPSLRLDLAPGLGFLSRRQVSTAIVDGTLLIEPTYSGSILPSATCCLCGVGLERWWGSEIILAPPKPIVPINVNSTMRKVLDRSSWGSSYFGGGKNQPTSPPSPTSSAPPTPPSIKETTALPDLPVDDTIPPIFALPNAPLYQQVHIFRINDTTTTSYAICPNYCLPRLRAVCEFWTCIRRMEKGLLLEEPSPINGVGGTSFARSSNLKSGFITPTNAGSRENLTLTFAEGEDKAVIVEDNHKGELSPREKEEIEEIIKEKMEMEERLDLDAAGVSTHASDADDDEFTAAVSAHASDDEELGLVDEKEEEEEEKDHAGEEVDAGDIGQAESEAVPEPTPSSPTLNKPPVPRRSRARQPGPNASTDSLNLTPSTSSEALPLETPSSSLDNLNASTTTLNLKPSPLGLGQGSQSSLKVEPVQAEELRLISFEEKTWLEVNRLKESMFWTRINAIGGEGIMVQNRNLVIE
jgi:hypothetical protein